MIIAMAKGHAARVPAPRNLDAYAQYFATSRRRKGPARFRMASAPEADLSSGYMISSKKNITKAPPPGVGPTQGLDFSRETCIHLLYT
jgi:hypothetical protein